jgi:hypothetical protein
MQVSIVLMFMHNKTATRQRSSYSFQTSDQSWHATIHACVLYIAQGWLYLFKELRKPREVNVPAALVREGNTHAQLDNVK